MASFEVDAIQIQSLTPTSAMQPFWLFDGKNVANEVENMARRCNTVSPNAIKEELYYERRPHSTAGFPLNYCKKQRERRFINSRQTNHHAQNFENDKYLKVLDKFQPAKTKDIVIGPGYVISKEKNEVTAKIKTGDLFNSGSYVQTKKSGNQKPDERNKTIEILKHQIDDLSAFLEEARVQHKTELKKTVEQHKDEIERIRKEHTEHLRAIESDHQEDIASRDESQRLIIETIREEANKERDQVARELKFMKAAFEAYKETVKEEMNSKWRQKELEIKLEFDKRAEQLLLEQRHEMTIQKNNELDKASKEQRRHIASITEANKKEMDILLRKFTASAADAERVHEFMTELQQVKNENSLLATELEDSKKNFRMVQNELNDTKVHLNSYKEHFDEKVSEVDDKYSQKINGLMMDNSTLRKQYLKKCDELYKVKSDNDVKKGDSIATAKDIMQQLILSKTRADVSLTALRAESPILTETTISARQTHSTKTGKTNGRNRPLSAPSTPKETVWAVAASSDEYTTSVEKRKKSSRPSSSFRIKTVEETVPVGGRPPSRLCSSPRVKSRAASPAITLSPPRLKSNKSLNSSSKGSSKH